MRQIIAVLLAVVTFIAFLPILPVGMTVQAATVYTEGDYTYSVSGSLATITEVNGMISGEVVIPYTLGDYPVVRIGDGAFRDCALLTSITVPTGVETIGYAAFRNCRALTSVSLPLTLTKISNSAFENCSALTGIEIPYSVVTIGSSAFEDCSSLNDIILPSGLKSIGYCAFYGTAYYSDQTNWSNGALYINSALIKSSIEASGAFFVKGGTTIIADEAFIYCSALSGIELPDSLVTIGKRAFYGCSALKEMYIPASVSLIDVGAFNSCYSLSAIDVDAGNQTYSHSGGVVFSKDKTEILFFPAGRSGIYSIPDNVVNIGDYAFSGCTSLTKVSIPASVTSIGDYAFAGCSALVEVSSPDSIEITLPFPNGITSENYENYSFVLYHFKDNNYEQLNAAVSSEGITLTTNRFGPFLITYGKSGEIAVPEQENDSTSVDTTGQPTNTIGSSSNSALANLLSSLTQDSSGRQSERPSHYLSR